MSLVGVSENEMLLKKSLFVSYTLITSPMKKPEPSTLTTVKKKLNLKNTAIQGALPGKRWEDRDKNGQRT